MKLLKLAMLVLACYTTFGKDVLIAKTEKFSALNNSGWTDEANKGCSMYFDCTNKKSKVTCSFTIGGTDKEAIKNSKINTHVHLNKCGADPNPHYKNDKTVTEAVQSNELWVPLQLSNSVIENASGESNFLLKLTETDKAKSFVLHHPTGAAMVLCANWKYESGLKATAEEQCKAVLASNNSVLIYFSAILSLVLAFVAFC